MHCDYLIYEQCYYLKCVFIWVYITVTSEGSDLILTLIFYDIVFYILVHRERLYYVNKAHQNITKVIDEINLEKQL